MEYLLYIAILPVIALLSYIYKKDIHKEPNKILAKVFLFGILTVIPAFILEVILSSWFPTENYKSVLRLFINVFIGVALVEEMLKWLVVKIFVYKSDEFDETFDAVVYAVFASLGFACIENILYVLLHGYGTGIARAITAVPLHACTGVIMGYFIGKSKLAFKNDNKSNESTYIFLSLLLPITVHAIYDFLILTRVSMYVIIWIAFIIIVYISCFVLVKRSTKNNERFVKEEILMTDNTNSTEVVNNSNAVDNNSDSNTTVLYCKYCGNRIDTSNYCSKCGKANEVKM